MRLGRPASGFTLVEVMITVFVIAIGLLSAAALQALSKKAAADAVQRSSANTLAQDILERLRGNRSQLAVYVPAQQRTVDASKLPTAQVCSSTSPCTPAQLAAYDIDQWWRGLDGAAEKIIEGTGSSATRSNAGGLRSPTGCIYRATGSCLVTVAIAWRGLTAIEQGDANNPDDPTNIGCGIGNADYDDPDQAAGNHRYRRVLVINANLGEGDPCLP